MKGDLQKLKAAAQNAFISLGSGAQSPLRGFVQDATSELRKLTRDGTIQRWGENIGSALRTVVADAKRYGPEIGSALHTVGSGVKSIAEGFSKLPPGVQQALITGAITAYGAHKLGVDSLAKGALKGLTKGGAKALGGALVSRGTPVPVFVVNEGFGGKGKESVAWGRSAPAWVPVRSRAVRQPAAAACWPRLATFPSRRRRSHCCPATSWPTTRRSGRSSGRTRPPSAPAALPPTA